jgi:predicted metal-dependent peptidase
MTKTNSIKSDRTTGPVAAAVNGIAAASDEADARLRLSAATYRLCDSHPYLACALWAVTRVSAPGIGTLGVDGEWRLYYDPAAVSRWTVPGLSAVLYHEVSHLLRDHAGRRPADTDPLEWNVCADAEINDGLRDEGQPLPKGAIFPSALGAPDGLLAEQYLPYLERKKRGGGRQPEDGGEPETRGEAAGSGPAGKQAGHTAEKQAGPGAEKRAGPCGGRCGSGAGGPPEEWEESARTDSTALGGVSPGITLAEAELVRRRTAQAIEEHARTRGTVPGGWRRWADQRLEPRLDWRRELAAIVRRSLADAAGASDYSYRRPSRRQACLGPVVTPSLRQPIPAVAVIVDTSGSVSGDLLDRALAEVSGVLRAAGQREGVTVLAVDAAVQSARRVFRAEQVCLKGGGGTDMGAGLAAVASLRPRPDVVIVITDGDTPWPAQPPHGTRVVVVLTNGPREQTPDWARTLHATDEAA